MKRNFCDRCGKERYSDVTKTLVLSDTTSVGTMRGVSGKEGRNSKILVTAQVSMVREGSSRTYQAAVCDECKKEMLRLAVLASPLLRTFAQEILDASEPASPIDETDHPEPKLRVDEVSDADSE